VLKRQVYCLSGHSVVAVALCKLYGLAFSPAEKIQLCTSFLAASYSLDVHYIRRMQRENAFHALIADYATDRKGLVDAATFATYYRTGKNLNSFLVAFLDFATDIDKVAYFKMRHLFFQVFAFDSIEQFCFHRSIS